MLWFRRTRVRSSGLKRRGLSELARGLAHVPPDQLVTLLEERLAEDAACPVARYLLGCHALDRGRPATAVRHLMVAHHIEPQLESAVLLVFAGLNWVGRRTSPLLPIVVGTWDEFHRPPFDRRPLERALLDAFAEADPGLAGMPPLARRLWRLPIRTLRAEIRTAVGTRDGALYPLLSAPA